MATQLCRIPAAADEIVQAATSGGGSAFVCSASTSAAASFHLVDLAAPALALLALLTAISYYYATLQYGRDRDITAKRKLAQEEFRQITSQLTAVGKSFEDVGELALGLADATPNVGPVLEKIRFRSRGAIHSFHGRLQRVDAWAQEYAKDWLSTFQLLDVVSENYDGIMGKAGAALRLGPTGMGPEDKKVVPESDSSNEGLRGAASNDIDVLDLCSELRTHCLNASRSIEDAVSSLEVSVNSFDFSSTVPSLKERLPFMPRRSSSQGGESASEAK